jgi:hypothetical protein
MKISNFSRHIFWSYKPEASIPTSQVVKQVIAYGEIPDLLKLAGQVPALTIRDIISKWKEKDRFKKRINFLEKIILSK